MKELRGIRGDVPFTDDEMAQGKGRAGAEPAAPLRVGERDRRRRSPASITQDLPGDVLPATSRRTIDAVTADDLVRVAQKYIDLDHLTIVIVGDRATIEGPLAATKIAPVVPLDADAKVIVVP